MPEYRLRSVPAPLWDRFVQKARADHWALGDLFTALISEYTDGTYQLQARPKPRPALGVGNFLCGNGHHVSVDLRKLDVNHLLDVGYVKCPVCGVDIPLTDTYRANLTTWAETNDETT